MDPELVTRLRIAELGPEKMTSESVFWAFSLSSRGRSVGKRFYEYASREGEREGVEVSAQLLKETVRLM